jgi:hypothetical protein
MFIPYKIWNVANVYFPVFIPYTIWKKPMFMFQYLYKKNSYTIWNAANIYVQVRAGQFVPLLKSAVRFLILRGYSMATLILHSQNFRFQITIYELDIYLHSSDC